MPSRMIPIAFALILASGPVLAQQASNGSAPPLVGPAPNAAPPSEIGLGTSQLFLGALTTLGAGLGLALLAAESQSTPLVYVALSGSPGVGAAVVCSLGQSSPSYEGGCAPTIIGGYVGAFLLAIPMAYVGAAAYAPSDPDGGRDSEVGAVLGAALGVVIGAAVGATIGWHASKHRRGSAPTVAPPSAPAPPAESMTSAELRVRSPAPAGVAFSVPLLSLRF